MKKLVETYSPIDDACEKWLIALDDLIVSDSFLAGIGVNPPNILAELGFPIVSNCAESFKLWGSQQIWGLPRPWPFQYYDEELSFAESNQQEYFIQSGGDINKVEAEVSSNNPGQGRIGQRLFVNYIDKKLSDIEANEAIKIHLVKEKGDGSIYDDGPIFDMIETSFYLLVKSCFMGGVDKSNFFKRMYEGFMAGGVPCGWQGDVSQKNGGKPEECLTMLHYGSLE